MIKEYGEEGDEERYLEWVTYHYETGYVVNTDKQGCVKQYPMIHHAKCKFISSASNHFTTGDYMKVCSLSYEALREWAASSLNKHKNKELTKCGHCMKETSN